MFLVSVVWLLECHPRDASSYLSTVRFWPTAALHQLQLWFDSGRTNRDRAGLTYLVMVGTAFVHGKCYGASLFDLRVPFFERV